jgi:hypothetical protein
MKSTKLDFERPRITDHGDLTQLTAAQVNGNSLDATFPVGTPASQLTFSN